MCHSRGSNHRSPVFRTGALTTVTRFPTKSKLKCPLVGCSHLSVNPSYKSIILPVVLYGCETLSLTLSEEHRLRVFENKVLRKIFGAKKDEITGEWRKLHNTELHTLYSSPNIIRSLKSRRLRWAGHVARKEQSRNAYRVKVGKN